MVVLPFFPALVGFFPDPVGLRRAGFTFGGPCGGAFSSCFSSFFAFLFGLFFFLFGLLFNFFGFFFFRHDFSRGGGFRFFGLFAFFDDFAQPFGPFAEGLLQLPVDVAERFYLFAHLARGAFRSDAVPFVGELSDGFEVGGDLSRGVTGEQLGVFAAAGGEGRHRQGAEGGDHRRPCGSCSLRAHGASLEKRPRIKFPCI